MGDAEEPDAGLVARALRAVDTRQAYRHDACVTTASWWRWRTRRDHGEAVRMVRTARRLAWHDDTRRAFEDGEIGHSHAAAIARAAIPRRREAIVAHEEGLVALARRATPREVATACQRVAELVDPDGSDASSNGADERRELYHSPTFQGLWDLRATLDPLTGERLHNLLNALSNTDGSDTPEDQRRSPAQVRHDAFDALLRAAEEHPDLPAVHGATPHALLTIDLISLTGKDAPAEEPGDAPTNLVDRDDPTAPGRRAPRLGSGVTLSLQRAADLLESAKLTPVLMAGPWRAVAVGRTHRTLPAWLRPVLTSIHRHCRGPGCDRPIAWTDAAHLDPWHRGGHTDLERTIPACRAHHTLMDQAGWKVDLDPDSAICTWSSPDGETIIRTHPPP